MTLNNLMFEINTKGNLCTLPLPSPIPFPKPVGLSFPQKKKNQAVADMLCKACFIWLFSTDKMEVFFIR